MVLPHAERVHAAELAGQLLLKQPDGCAGAIGLAIWGIYEAGIAHNAKQRAELQTKLAKAQQEMTDQQTQALKKQAELAEAKSRLAQMVSLTHDAENAAPARPIAGLFYSALAFNEVGKSPATADLVSSTEDAFHKALADIGGRGYGAGQGPINLIAVAAESKGDPAPKLRWLASVAAKEADGAVVLWDVNKDLTATPTRLIGAYAPMQRLWIARATGWLIAASASGSKPLLTLWKMDSPDRRPKIMESLGTPYLAHDDQWLHTSAPGRVKLYNLGSADPPTAGVDVQFETKNFTVRFESYSADGKWLALINPQGEACVCNLDEARKQGTIRAVSLKPADSTGGAPPALALAVNGEFITSIDPKQKDLKLVVFLNDGRVRVWSSAAGQWNQPAAEAKLKTPFAANDPVLVQTNQRGSYAVVARRSAPPGSAAAKLPATPPVTGPRAKPENLAYLFERARPGPPDRPARVR